MKKSGFKIDMQEMLEYTSKNLKAKIPKNVQDKYNKTFKENTEDDLLDNLTSLNSKTEKIEKSLVRKVVFILIFVPFVLFITKAVLTTYNTLKNESRASKKEDNNTTKLTLSTNETFKWRILKDQETQNLNSKIKKLSVDLRSDLNTTSINIKSDVKHQLESVNTNLELIKSMIVKNQTITETKINSLKVTQNKFKQELLTNNQNIESKIKNIKITNVIKGSNGLQLPKLPPLNGSGSISGKNSNSKNNNFIDLKNSSKQIPKKLKNKTKVVEYEILEDEVVEESISLSIGITKKEKIKKTLPNFTIMPGFAKGILVNGGEVTAINNGDDNQVVPIYIRINGDQLIANDDSVSLDGCLILATARGDLSKQAVELRLSKISCNLTDIDGNSYRAEQNIAGWVFSETGEYGIKGRLVSREKQIIKAGLPLAIVESMTKALANALGSANTSVVIPETTDTLGSIKQGGIQGLTDGSSAVLKKFSDYYMKLLESLTPTISIRAGREVVVAFKGGEKIAVEKYEPVDVGYFDEESDYFEEEIDE